MINLDMRGKPCPIPVVTVKKELANTETRVVSLLVDNIAAVENLKKLATGLGYTFTHTNHEEDDFFVCISKADTSDEYTENREDNVIAENKLKEIEYNCSSNTILIKSKRFGTGDKALGSLLIKGFIYSLTQLDSPPQEIIFVNSGVKLLKSKGAVLEDLTQLIGKGTRVTACGTCIQHYKIENLPSNIEVCNMMELTEKITTADKVITI